MAYNFTSASVLESQIHFESIMKRAQENYFNPNSTIEEKQRALRISSVAAYTLCMIYGRPEESSKIFEKDYDGNIVVRCDVANATGYASETNTLHDVFDLAKKPVL